MAIIRMILRFLKKRFCLFKPHKMPFLTHFYAQFTQSVPYYNRNAADGQKKWKIPPWR